ncbi:HAD family hydrolase [Thauera sinica]|uniref:HAD family hydrolase n=1 Tax=Thauera sinica TaxID=2665146 RepID=A0ABW1ALS6_9RHOO|nr:HAD-IB family hydrolase [Thauera sp. K11]
MTPERELALFDLDFTLVPFDSGMQWVRFLMAGGMLEAGFDDAYLALCRRYVAGEGDAAAPHRFMLGSLARLRADELPALQRRFAATLADAVPKAAHALVAGHRTAGHVCCIVTATTRAIAAPFAGLFGIEHLIASEAQRDSGGRHTGEISGELCHGVAKVRRVAGWLQSRGEDWYDYPRTTFYSDSSSDLPLLSAVSHPVAIRPDETLRRHAAQQGWPVFDDLQALHAVRARS